MILAELAGQIAPSRAKRQHRCSRQEMVEWLFLYGINTKSAGAPPGGQDNLIILTRPDEAKPSLPFTQLAQPRTDIALDAPIVQFVPILSFNSAAHT